MESITGLACMKMDAIRKRNAFDLLNAFLREDEFYLASSAAYGDAGAPALERALDLFLAHPETGFVWLAYVDAQPVAACVVCYAISTSMGARVAKLDDVVVIEPWQRQGVGTAMLRALADELRKEGVRRIDTSVYKGNQAADGLYSKLGFQNLGEERLACVLEP